MKILSRYVAVIFLCMFYAPAVSANNPTIEAINILQDMYSDFQDHIRLDLPSYTLERKVRTFDDRINATGEVRINTNPEGAVATLHDHNTGEPLENCLTPCVLHLNGNRDYLLTLFKFGHLPKVNPYRLEDYHETSVPYELSFNLLTSQRKGRKCFRDFAKSIKVDGEAKPCMRMGAAMPMNAKKSGHCIVNYDLTARGIVTNASAKLCTHDVFEAPSLQILEWWVFTPKVERGEAVASYGYQTKLTYKLRDEKGQIIPE